MRRRGQIVVLLALMGLVGLLAVDCGSGRSAVTPTPTKTRQVPGLPGATATAVASDTPLPPPSATPVPSDTPAAIPPTATSPPPTPSDTPPPAPPDTATTA
ncbi:MAG: hypothetical protein PVJ34_17725, partial [Anaerolineae bacterium]